ncbi:FkbM family methyltransferase [Erythrobacter sp. HL-111]|uniref:FkbM family methyltransferase n=1 Tax=Erythrobacter sp. HL-111 TaxID=1798193 RepID=UPI00087C0E97|nr:FkbM family methyltransferase [Erythrobacter sp. HL-111]SDS66405.1 methyltransferase, FkbM family [Erythrobacter sp. HL-111]
MRALRPEYIYRPAQIVRRMAKSVGLTANKRSAKTPWGLPINFDPSELHGRAMLTLGLSDLRTCEMISRIVRPGDRVVDIGANIGIMTSLMSRRAGENGAVFAFEPHPQTRERLKENVRAWNACSLASSHVEVLPYAVSSRAGTSQLVEPETFGNNSGVARLTEGATDGRRAHRVDTIIFDEWCAEGSPIRLVKIDVEGHEDDVFAGMSKSLANARIDFLIFEEMRELPSVACESLAGVGYMSFLIDRNFYGPRLIPVVDRPRQLIGEATNIIAVEKGKSIEFLEQGGWSCLRGGLRR